MDFKKSDKVWKWLEKNGNGFSKKKIESNSKLSKKTIEKYKYDFHRMMKMVEENTGKTDPAKVKPKEVYAVIDELKEKYQRGETAHSSFLRSIDDSLHAFTCASTASGVYKREVRLGKKEDINKKLNESGIYRRASESSVLNATREEVERVLDQIRKSNSPVKEVAQDVLQLQLETGKRISAILRSKKEDFDEKNSDYITKNDKGGKENHTFFLNNTAKEILERNTEGKKDGDMIFKVKYSNEKSKEGQDKSVENVRKQISTLISKAAAAAEVNVEGKKFSSHSARKAFAQERYEYYKTLNSNDLHAELERRRKLDSQIDKNLHTLLKNIRNKFKNKEKGCKREFTDEEKAKILVSTDINHSRLDVMRYYIQNKS